MAKKCWRLKQKKKAKFTSRKYNRCSITGRRRAYIGRFGVSRIQFREMALKGEIPSVLARPSGCEFHTRCPLARPRCAKEEPRAQQITPERMVRCHFAEETKQQT